MSSAGALAGARILDVGGPLTAYCTRILTDLGAEVVVVEPRGGESSSDASPTSIGPADEGLLDAYYYAGPRLDVDWWTTDGQARLAELGAETDVVVIAPTKRRPLWGWAPETRSLTWAPPTAVVLSLTPFGLTGPCRDWRATPMVSFAMGGRMLRVGEVEGPPLSIPGRQQWDEAGAHAALAIAAALHSGESRPNGLIDLAVHEIAAAQDAIVEQYSVMGSPPHNRVETIGIPPTGAYDCVDGRLDISAHQLHHWDAFLVMLGNPESLNEPSLRDPHLRQLIFDGLREEIQALLAHRSCDEMVERGQAAGLPCSKLQTATAFFRDPHVVARGTFVSTPGPDGALHDMPGPGFRSTPSIVRERTSTPARRARDEASSSMAPRSAERESGGTSTADGGPLAGLRVLSLGLFIAGGMPGSYLGQLGADVVKVESRSHPEVLRNPVYAYGGPVAVEPCGVTTTIQHVILNTSTRNLSLEISSAEGAALFHRLVRKADVVIENFRDGVLDRWGCGFERLLEENPRLVMTSISGYGRSGPRASHLAYASNICNFTGLTHAWSGRTHVMHCDYVAAQHAAIATVSAVRSARAGGRGIHVDVSQIEAVAAIMPEVMIEASVHGRDVVPGNVVTSSTLSGVYRSTGADAWVAVDVEDLSDWNVLCTVLDRPDLRTSGESGAPNVVDLDLALRAWIESRTAHTATLLLQAAGLAAGPVQSSEDVWRDPQLRSRGAFADQVHPDLGTFTSIASPYRSMRATGATRPASRLGQDTVDILGEWLDLSALEVDALIDTGVIFQS
jgi:crotonobetainyl-CoA:carnitine CoA-transferase CaiB-like acyl-CoA transferase